MKRFLLTLLATIVVPAAAQEPATTRTREGSTTTILYETEIPIAVSMELPPNRNCAADIALTYVQVNTVAKVEGELNNTSCAASSGAYTIAISIRDANGETQRLEFTEAWGRTDDKPIAFEGNYPIGENVDLLRVRTSRITCSCAETP